MSLPSDDKAEKTPISIPDILADFFLRKIEMGSYSDDSSHKYKGKRKKSKHKKGKHKKSKYRSRSSSKEPEYQRKDKYEDVSSSEEISIKRLEKIKNLRLNSKLNSTLECTTSKTSQEEAGEKKDPSGSTTEEQPVYYGPSLELLLSGVEPNSANTGSVSDELKKDTNLKDGLDKTKIINTNKKMNACSETTGDSSPPVSENITVDFIPGENKINTYKHVNTNEQDKYENSFGSVYKTNGKDSVNVYEIKDNNSFEVRKENDSDSINLHEMNVNSCTNIGENNDQDSISFGKINENVDMTNKISSEVISSNNNNKDPIKEAKGKESTINDKVDDKSKSSIVSKDNCKSKENKAKHEGEKKNHSRSRSRSRSKPTKNSSSKNKRKSRSRSSSRSSHSRTKKRCSRSLSHGKVKSRSRSRSRSKYSKHRRSHSRSPRKHRISRSRSRSRGMHHSRSRSRRSNSRHRNQSTSGYRNELKSCRRSKSRCRSRHRSKSNDRKKNKSHSRSASRSRLRSKSKDRKKSKYRSRSSSRSRLVSQSKLHKRNSRSKSQLRSNSKDTKKTKSRSRSDSRSRHRSKSKDRKTSKSRSSSRHRSKSKDCKKGKSHSRSVSRSRLRSRSKDRKKSKSPSSSASNSRKGSKAKCRKSKSRSRSASKSRHVSKKKTGRKSKSRSRSRSKSKSEVPSKTREKSLSKSRSMSKERKSNKIDRAKILETAKRNVLKMMKDGTLPEGLNVENLKKETLTPIQAGGKSVQEFTDFCQRLSQRENDPDDKDDSKDDDASDNDTGFIHHPFKVKEPAMIKLNIKNAVQLPIKTHSQKIAELSSQFPVSSGNQHKQKELEWIPVVPDTQKSEVKSIDKKAAVSQNNVTTVAVVENPVSSTPLPPSLPISYPCPVSEVPAVTSVPPLMPPPMPPSLFVAPVQTSMPALPPPPPPEIQYTMPSNQPMMIMSNVSVPAPRPTPSTSVFKPPRKIDISSIVTKRFQALTKLQENPNDPEALATLQNAQQDIQDWVESQQVPGLFTGSTDAKVLSVAELCGPKYYSKFRKDIFTSAPPLSEGKGMSLLKKMGWNPGEGLGKNKEGSLEPLVLDIKMDKKGLVSEGENSKKGMINSFSKELQGKHPVSALMELCSKRKWKPPLYTCVMDTGPPHKKQFSFKVEVNGIEYQPVNPCANKKVAKADCAIVCLQALNVFPKTAT